MSNVFSLACREDGPGILNIMESDVAKGDIQLLYTRRPNPYDSFKTESDSSVVGVFKNNGEIVGTIAGVPIDMYIEGKRQRVCYVTNMKRLESLKSHVNWITAFKEMYDPLDSRVYYCSVVKENEGVLKMLKKVRKNLPYALDMDGYRTYIISHRTPVKNSCPDLVFCQATNEDEEAVLGFLKKWGEKKNFFPVTESLDGVRFPGITSFYMLKSGGEIKAVGALWDKRDSKQYVVKGYSGKVAALRLFNPLISLFGYITIPPAGTEAAFTFLSFFLAEDDNKDYYRTFLHHIRREVKKTHDMFVLGTSDHNPKREVLDEVRSLKFDTQMCEIVMSNFRGMDKLDFDPHNIEVECALL